MYLIHIHPSHLIHKLMWDKLLHSTFHHNNIYEVWLNNQGYTVFRCIQTFLKLNTQIYSSINEFHTQYRVSLSDIFQRTLLQRQSNSKYCSHIKIYSHDLVKKHISLHLLNMIPYNPHFLQTNFPGNMVNHIT